MENTLKVQLTNAKEVVVVREVKKIVSEINIISINDDYISKKVIARLTDAPFTLVLWEAEDYDTIGQWTDTDVVNRINELYA